MANSKRPILALDIDGVIANFSGAFLKLANERFGLKCHESKQVSWDFAGCQGVTKFQEDVIWKEINGTDNWWLNLEPLPDTDLLAALAKDYQIFFVTARPEIAGMSMVDQTVTWLRRHFFIANPIVIGCKHKGPLLASLNVQYFIDDKPENIADVRVNSPFTKCFLHDQPYNQDYKQGSVTRVQSLNEFFTKLQGALKDHGKAA